MKSNKPTYEELEKRVAELEQIERELLDNKIYLEIMFDSTLNGIMVIDADKHTIANVNSAAAKMIGLNREDIIGQICHNFVCPATQGKCPISDLGLKIDKSERDMLTAKGEIRKIIKTVHPLTINKKEYFIESFIDISKLKDTEEQLRKSENLFRSAIENSPIGIAVVSRESGAALSLNQQFTKLFGYTIEDTPDIETWYILAHPDEKDRQEVKDRWEEELALLKTDPANSKGIEVSITCKNKKIKNVNVQLSSIGDVDLVTFYDLTEIKTHEVERETLINELTEALSKVKVLSGLMPICSKCKKIRDDKGYWNQLETYIEQNSDAFFSHGLCPECAESMYGDKEWYIKKKLKNKKTDK